MDDVAPPAMPTLVRVSVVLLVICALVSVPWSVHNLAMLLGHENFGWGIFAIFFFDAPMALLQLVLAVVLTAQGARAPKWAVIAAWSLTSFTAVTAVCVVAFGKASGC